MTLKRSIISISALLSRLDASQDDRVATRINYNDPDDLFFCEMDGTNPSYTLDKSKTWAILIENEEVYVYRIYSGRTIDDLTVHPLDRVNAENISDYDMGYLNSYFYQMYQSGEIY